MNLQPVLEDELILARPLKENDFEELFSVASDPAIWEQHPNKDRYKREVFEKFFEGAIRSGGAYLVYDKKSKVAIGGTRFYDFDPAQSQLLIGYTFFAKSCWGKGYNHRLKRLMLNYAFNFVDKIIFHIGALNIRSQKSIEKLGAVKTGELEVKYYGEIPKLNFEYQILKKDYLR